MIIGILAASNILIALAVFVMHRRQNELNYDARHRICNLELDRTRHERSIERMDCWLHNVHPKVCPEDHARYLKIKEDNWWFYKEL